VEEYLELGYGESGERLGSISRGAVVLLSGNRLFGCGCNLVHFNLPATLSLSR